MPSSEADHVYDGCWDLSPQSLGIWTLGVFDLAKVMAAVSGLYLMFG